MYHDMQLPNIAGAATEARPYYAEANKTLDDLKAAINMFDNVTDPELVSYASYEIEALRLKYQYLLRKIRESSNV